MTEPQAVVSPAQIQVQSPRKRSRRVWILGERDYWMMTVPALLVLSAGIVLPLADAIYLSFRNFNLMQGTDSFVGFANYHSALTDPLFLQSIGRTLLYVVVVVSADFVVGFSQALLLYRLSPKIGKIMKGIFLLPILLIPSAAAMFWRFIMYNPPFQIFNQILHVNPGVSVLGEPKFAFWGIILTVVWAWSPWVFLLLSGGLESLPTEPLEAAQLDGASFWQVTWHIILPMMRPVIFVTLSLKAVDSFLTFPFPWVMTEGGPAGSSHVLSTYIYERSFRFLNYGYGSAMAIIMLLIGLVLSSIVIRVVRRNEYV